MGDREGGKGEGDGIYKRKREEEQRKGRGERNSAYCSLAKCAVRCIWPLKPEGGERRIEGGRQTDSENMKEKRKERKRNRDMNLTSVLRAMVGPTFRRY